MFSYFGSKSKLVDLYPAPEHEVIIEPFCGSARYALEHYKCDVILNDINPQVIAIWRFLQQATTRDILQLPILKVGDHIDDFKELTQVEKDLIGFELCRGKAVPRKVVSKFSNWEQARKRIADDLHKIRHWRIIEGDYSEIFNCTATWFIDPPYILEDKTGMNYVNGHKQIDYQSLAGWIKERKGQVITCAGTNDNWLPFRTLKPLWNGGKLGEEKIYLQ